jgi:hypothetical protein
MKPTQLSKRIEELSEKLKPVPSEGIRIDFYSFTGPEQLVLLKNMELDEKYQGRWTREAILENKDLILKANHIVIQRTIEWFQFAMPRAMMLDEVDQWFFRLHFNLFWERWFECQNHVRHWSKKDRADFIREMKISSLNSKANIENGEKLNGKNNN